MGKFVKNLMEEKEDKYTHTQKPKSRQRIGCRRKDNYGWGSFKLAADSRVRRKTTRLYDDEKSKNGWESGREKKSITEVAAVAICQIFFLENV